MSKRIKERSDSEASHDLIRLKVLEYYQENDKLPTQTKVAELTGLARNTVRTHWFNLDFRSMLLPTIRHKTMEVVQGLYERAKKGYASEVSLWFQIVEGWQPNKGEKPKSRTIILNPEVLE